MKSSVSVQKLFYGSCSIFKRPCDEFVGEKVVSPSYSFAILGLPSDFRIFIMDFYTCNMVENIFCILDKLQMGLYNFGNILHIFIYNQHALPEHTHKHIHMHITDTLNYLNIRFQGFINLNYLYFLYKAYILLKNV